MSPAPLHAMDRFPCARLTSPYHSIGSNLDSGAHEYDTVFEAAIEKGPAHDATNARKIGRCELTITTVQAWLLSIIRPLGQSRFLGTVPMNIHGLRFSPSCIALDDRTWVSRIEFVVHRYADAQGVHYTCLISSKLPYKLYAYKRIGTVPAGMLWSVDRES